MHLFPLWNFFAVIFFFFFFFLVFITASFLSIHCYHSQIFIMILLCRLGCYYGVLLILVCDKIMLHGMPLPTSLCFYNAFVVCIFPSSVRSCRHGKWKKPLKIKVLARFSRFDRNTKLFLLQIRHLKFCEIIIRYR